MFYVATLPVDCLAEQLGHRIALTRFLEDTREHHRLPRSQVPEFLLVLVELLRIQRRFMDAEHRPRMAAF